MSPVVVGVERKQDAPGTLEVSRHATKDKKTQNISEILMSTLIAEHGG
jgi:hypothetical protein